MIADVKSIYKKQELTIKDLVFLDFKTFMKKNIAVVGCGHWGKNLVRNFYELGVLASICDPNIELQNNSQNNIAFKIIHFQKLLMIQI